MRIKITIIIIAFTLFHSCKGKGIDETKTQTYTEADNLIKKQPENLESKTKVTKDFSFLKDVKTVNLPFTDSTNFDNHKIKKLLTQKQIENLGLNEIFKIPPNAYSGFKIGVNYKLNLSPNFESLVFYLYFFDHEMSSTLVNYDAEYNVIDYKMIAMDEIAESVLRAESRIEKDKIIITNFQFWNKTIKETQVLRIQPDGKLKTLN